MSTNVGVAANVGVAFSVSVTFSVIYRKGHKIFVPDHSILQPYFDCTINVPFDCTFATCT